MTKHTSVWKRAQWIATLLLGFAVLLPAGLAAQEEEEKGIPVLFSDFEDGKLGDWHGRGHDANIEKVDITTEAAHSGKYSIKISNRTTTWQGPQHLLVTDPKPGSIYRVKAWLFFNEGPSDTTTFNLSIEKAFQDPKANHSYANIKFLPVSKGKWTEFVSEFVVPADNTIKSLDVYFEIPWKSNGDITPADTISFFIDDIKIDQLDPANRPKIEDDIPSLTETLGKWFVMGAAAMPEEVAPSNQSSRLFLKHFGILTPGNTMKWDSIEPKEGEYNWGPANAIVDFAGLGGMAVHGHTLVWHAQTPAWVFQDPADPTKPASKEVLIERIKNHIGEVVGNYVGLVGSWDVVNEVISDTTGTLRSAAEGSKWMEIIGPEFIEIAFRAAKEADPDAKLAINEYGVESNVKKRDALYNLVKDLKKKGVPIDIVGLQMHINLYSPSVKEIKDCIQKFADLGVKVQITELDMSIYSSADEKSKKADAAILLAQAKRYKEIFDVFKDFAKKKVIQVVTLWGGSDDGSWLNDFPVKGRGDAPLLFDRKLKAKPAFWAIIDPKKVKGL